MDNERITALIKTLHYLWVEHDRLMMMRWSSAHREMLIGVNSEIGDTISTLLRLTGQEDEREQKPLDRISER